MTLAATAPWPALLTGVLTGCATFIGGGLALRFRSALGLFLGFSSGAVIGVALFDLLPEALQLGRPSYDPLAITTAVGLGFAAYLVLDRLPALLNPHRDHGGYLGPGSLTVHSLMDGLGIGLAFQASAAIGWVVALAVLAHDILDGANTVILSLSNRSSEAAARRWLIADALAPLAGIGLAQVIQVPRPTLVLVLATFGGFFLYIGASELLPRSHADRPRLSTLAATGLGMSFIYGVVRLANL